MSTVRLGYRDVNGGVCVCCTFAWQLDRLLQLHLPKLHAHLSRESVAPDMYAAGADSEPGLTMTYGLALDVCVILRCR